MKIKIGSDGGNSCRFTLSGELSKIVPKPLPILSFANLSLKPRGLKLDAVQFAIQEKAGFKFWWALPDNKYEFLLVLESRGGFDFEKINSIASPPEAIGLAFTAFKITEADMGYVIMMDFSKL